MAKWPPCCMGVAVHKSMAYCTCDSTKKRKELEDRVAKLEEQMKQIIQQSKRKERP